MSTTRRTTIRLSDPVREVEGFDDYRAALRQLVTGGTEPAPPAHRFRRRPPRPRHLEHRETSRESQS